MTDRVLKNAISQRNELQAKRDALAETVVRLDGQIAVIDAFIDQWHKFAEGRDDQPEDDAFPAVEEREPAPRRRAKPGSNPRKEDIARVAAEIIAEKGRPVPRSEMLAELEQRGLKLNGTDPLKVLSTMLWRMSSVVGHSQGHGYILPSWASAPDDEDHPLAERDPEASTRQVDIFG